MKINMAVFISLVTLYFSNISIAVSKEFWKAEPNSFYLLGKSSGSGWPRTSGGLVIKSDGTVLCFTYTNPGRLNYDKNGFVNADEYSKTYKNPFIIRKVKINNLPSILDSIKQAKDGPIVRANIGADMGGRGTFAFAFNDQMSKMKRFTLYEFGSWVVDNKSPSAEILLKEFEKISGGRDLEQECGMARANARKALQEPY